MKIQQLEYHDRVFQWKLEPVEFYPNLNLLVGLSGAGKTKIIEAIQNLKEIANGRSVNGIKWRIKFLTENNIDYEWQGEFELRSQQVTDYLDLDKQTKHIPTGLFLVLKESLIKNNDRVIFERKSGNLYLQEKETPKLVPFVSALYLLSQEEEIQPIVENFKKIISNDLHSNDKINRVSGMADDLLAESPPNSLIELKKSQLPLFLKIVLLSRHFPDEFEKIQARFREVFTQIENIKINQLEKDIFGLKFGDRLPDFLQIEIKEAKVDDWIEQRHISSGMLKTLIYISELYLCPDDSVILIDEFENSLGVNCLDSVTDLILDNPHLQFIITSHHPYIINNISPEYWKIVTRRGSVVTVKTAEDFHISKSRQKAFIDLINVLEEDDDDWEDE
jgi:hypothetical protein